MANQLDPAAGAPVSGEGAQPLRRGGDYLPGVRRELGRVEVGGVGGEVRVLVRVRVGVRVGVGVRVRVRAGAGVRVRVRVRVSLGCLLTYLTDEHALGGAAVTPRTANLLVVLLDLVRVRVRVRVRGRIRARARARVRVRG